MQWGATSPAVAGPWWQSYLDSALQTLIGAVAVTLAGWLGSQLWKRVVAPWLRQRRHIKTERDRERSRELLVHSTWRVWIDGYLARAVDQSALPDLPVGLEVPDSVLWGDTDDHVATLANVWRRNGRRQLRLIGEWGTGKTIHLLRLAEALLDAADPRDTASVPVVVNVSNWTAAGGTFDRWLLDELARRHELSRGALEDLYASGQLALLLDGVDEHPQPGECAAAIAALLEATPELELVVAYRTGSHEASSQRQQWIDHHLAARLDPVEVVALRRAQVDGLLAQAGERWHAARQIIHDHADLWEPLMRRPVMLTTVMRALRDRPTDELPVLSGTVEERRRALYDMYIDAVVADRLAAGDDGDGQIGSTADVRSALGVLAAATQRCGLGTSIHLEHLSPDWLPSSAHQHRARRHERLGVGVVGGLGGAVVGGLVFGLLGALAAGMTFGVAGGLFVGLGVGLVGTLAFPDVPLAGCMSWSWQTARARGLNAALLRGRRTIVIVGPFFALVFALGQALARDPASGTGLLATGAVGLVLGVAVGLAVGVVSVGLQRVPPDLGSAPYPVLLRRSVLLNIKGWGVGVAGVTAGLLAVLIAALVVGFALVVGADIGDLRGVLAGGLLVGVLFGLVVGLFFGLAVGLPPAVRYWTVQRELYKAELIPSSRLVDFLDWCTGHQGPLLLPVGYGYRFLHPTFQEHLASWRHERPPSEITLPDDIPLPI